MAYTKKTWECGETITADALNRMEDGIEEALQSGGGTAGYSCTETKTLLTEETVTTAVDPEYPDDGAFGDLSYVFSEKPPETLHITFNGVEYNCDRQQMPDGYAYSSDNVFTLFAYMDGTTLLTPSAGTYSIKLEVINTSVETSECFQKAVKSISAPLVVNASVSPFDASVANKSYLDASLDDIATAFLERGVAVVAPNGNIYPITKIEWADRKVTVGEYQYAVVNDNDILAYPTVTPT